MAKNITIETKIEPVLKVMAVGEKRYFAIEKLKSVLSSCSSMGVVLSRKFKTQRFPTLGYVQVTRTI